MPESKTIYTVMADFGGAYAWICRDGKEHFGVGGNIAGFGGWGGDLPISNMLEQALEVWQATFERFELAHRFDWASFHEEGLRLAHALKAELGDVARVIYEKPYEDPGRDIDERQEMLAGGEVLLLPGRKAMYASCGLSDLVTEIISGGQTGADRAALDWAIAHGVPHGGWCPQGRKAEDGQIPLIYQLKETDSEGYLQRTRCNIQGSDGTLILNLGELDGGSLKTAQLAEKLDKPYLILQLDSGKWPEQRDEAIYWLKRYGIACLNIAGPREGKRPGVFETARKFLDLLNEDRREV